MIHGAVVLSLGLYYLQGIHWIENQLKLWRGGGASVRYVEGLESALVAALNVCRCLPLAACWPLPCVGDGTCWYGFDVM